MLLGQAGAQQLPVPSWQAPGMDGTVAMIGAGDFAGAQARIDAALAGPALTLVQRAAWEFQRERMRRMRLDFGLDRTQVLARLRRQVPDLTDAEFVRWDADGWLEHFVPAKQFVRSETVDNQRGEVEWRGGNLYFDQWTYDFRWQVLPAGAD